MLTAMLVGSVLPARAEDRPADCSARPDVLGTSRVAVIGEQGPHELGLKSYPHTLQLSDHEVVLTFDDGPSRKTTPRVLAALAKECVHATFFLIGRNAASAPALVRQEIAEGHTVGHHTFSHPEITMRGLTEAKARADIDKGFVADDKAGYGTAAANPRVPFFRFPGFADTADLDAWLASRHIEVFGADLWASDWITMTPEEELRLLMGRLNAAGRGIILLHDVKEQTAEMVPALLQALKDNHFKLVHIVPGSGVTASQDAPPGWKSETERTIATVWPKLVKLGARSPMPAAGGVQK
jgi:peptidoglycan/xylan/chitin deacetylase (PgdA/CDA1 family)